MPVTFMDIMFICDIGIMGSMGAVAEIVTVPVNVVHCAMPLELMVTPAGTGAFANGIPMVHITCGMAVMGAML